DAECAGCRIELSDSVLIGRDGDSVALTTRLWAVRRGDGHIFVTGTYGVGGVAEYDSSGRFLRLLGGQGSGPNEFAGPPSRPTLLRGDTLAVFDLRLQRFMIIAPDGTLLRTFSPGFRPWDVTSSPDGMLLVTGAVPSPDPFEQGPPGHLLRTDGTVVRSVGDSLGAVGGERSAVFKQVAMSSQGSVALADFSGYDITLHYSDGSRRVLSRKADWFTPPPLPDERIPRVTELWFDDADRLWVTLHLPVAANVTNERDELL